MRELKFRLLKDGKIVGYEKWYAGQGDEDSITSAKAHWLYSAGGKYWSPDYIEHDDKDQFTGLLEKNDVEIYEGDVVTFGGGHNDVIIWRDGALGYVIHGEFIPLARIWPGTLPKSVEVVGNIHENPELIA